MRAIVALGSLGLVVACTTATSGLSTSRSSSSSSSTSSGGASSTGAGGHAAGGSGGGHGGGGAGGGACKETNGAVTFKLNLPDGTWFDQHGSSSDLDVTAIVTGSSMGSFDFDTCPPGSTCKGTTTGKLTYAADGLTATVPVGALVRIVYHRFITPGPSWAGGALVVRNVNSFGTATTSFKGSLWMVLLAGETTPQDVVLTPELSLGAQKLSCNLGGSSGGGDCAFTGTGGWAWTLTAASDPKHPAIANMGTPLTGWMAEGVSLDISNLAAWAHDLCDAKQAVWIARTP